MVIKDIQGEIGTLILQFIRKNLLDPFYFGCFIIKVLAHTLGKKHIVSFNLVFHLKKPSKVKKRKKKK